MYTSKYTAPTAYVQQAPVTSQHLEELNASAISPQVIAERGYRSITDPSDLPKAFADYQRRPGLLIPIRDVHGNIATYLLKPDSPRMKDGKSIKYEAASAGRPCIDVPTSVRPLLGDPSIPLWITEGAKKVDSAINNGVRCIVGFPGVWNWRGTNEHGGKAALPDWESIALNDREVIIAFDSDAMRKDSVRSALDRLTALLVSRGARARFLLLGDRHDGSKAGLDDAFADGATLEDLLPCIVDFLPHPEWEWEEPIPLDDLQGPPFPVQALPGRIGIYVAAVAEETQTPPDMAAIVALGTISAAAGGKFTVRDKWDEPAHIYAVAVAPPGMRKSQVVSQLTRPIAEWERERQQEEARSVEEWASRNRTLEQQRNAAEKVVVSVGMTAPDGKPTNEDRLRSAAVHEHLDHQKTRPYLTRVFVDDATPEAVTSHLYEQGGSVAVISAEGGGYLANIAGRYGDSPNLDVFLKGHAGDSIVVDRKGRESEFIERACLTLCLTLQPSVITDLGKMPGFHDRGGTARLLAGFIPDHRGHENLDAPSVPSELRDFWSSTIRHILTRRPLPSSDGKHEPWTLHLNDEAKVRFRAFREAHQLVMREGGALREIAGWGAKLPGAVLRVAGLLHIALNPIPELHAVTGDTLSRSIDIGRYLAAHAQVMHRMLGQRTDRGDAVTVLDALRSIAATKGAGESVTQRDLYRKLRGRIAFEKSEYLSAPLALLEDLGHIRRVKSQQRSIRPTVELHLHPRYDMAKRAKRSEQTHPEPSFVHIGHASPAISSALTRQNIHGYAPDPQAEGSGLTDHADPVIPPGRTLPTAISEAHGEVTTTALIIKSHENEPSYPMPIHHTAPRTLPEDRDVGEPSQASSPFPLPPPTTASLEPTDMDADDEGEYF